MKLDVTSCEVLSLDSGVATCPVDGEEHPVVLLTIRITGQQEPINLAVRNPFRLQEDLDAVIKASTVLNGGEFVPED